VVAMLKIKNAGKLYKTAAPLLKRLVWVFMKSEIKNRGTNAKKISGAKPFTGHERANSTPLKSDKSQRWVFLERNGINIVLEFIFPG
jgi:hypothetical protein